MQPLSVVLAVAIDEESLDEPELVDVDVEVEVLEVELLDDPPPPPPHAVNMQLRAVIATINGDMRIAIATSYSKVRAQYWQRLLSAFVAMLPSCGIRKSSVAEQSFVGIGAVN